MPKNMLINWKGYREEHVNLFYRAMIPDIRLKKLNLMLLEKRRILTDVTFLYKVLNGDINIDVSKIIDFYSEADCFSPMSKDILNFKESIHQN